MSKDTGVQRRDVLTLGALVGAWLASARGASAQVINIPTVTQHPLDLTIAWLLDENAQPDYGQDLSSANPVDVENALKSMTSSQGSVWDLMSAAVGDDNKSQRERVRDTFVILGRSATSLANDPGLANASAFDHLARLYWQLKSADLTPVPVI
jgi:hypothetical protein